MAALGPLRRALLPGMISGTLILAAAPSGALAVGSPDPVVTVALGPPGNAPGEDAEKGSTASGRDADIEGDVFLPPTPAELKTIIQRTLSAVDLQTLVREAARGAGLETDARVQGLGAELDLREEALARMFEILGREDVPPERLADVLAEIVARHKILLERVRLLEASDPRAAELRDAAAAAIETAEYDRADALLAEAAAIELEAMRQLQEGRDQRALNAAAIPAQWSDGAGTPLEYGAAVQQGALLHGDGGAGSEASLQFVPRDRFCRSRPEDRLCQRWAESSSLCERQPDHPLCEDDDDERFCEKRPDHPLCDDGQPPSPS